MTFPRTLLLMINPYLDSMNGLRCEPRVLWNSSMLYISGQKCFSILANWKVTSSDASSTPSSPVRQKPIVSFSTLLTTNISSNWAVFWVALDSVLINVRTNKLATLRLVQTHVIHYVKCNRYDLFYLLRFLHVWNKATQADVCYAVHLNKPL